MDNLKINYEELNKYNSEFIVVGLKTVKLCSKYLRDTLRKTYQDDIFKRVEKLEDLEHKEEQFITLFLDKYKNESKK